MLNEFEQLVGRANVIQTLAKEYRTGKKNSKTGEALVVAPYGLDLVYQSIKEK